MKHYVVLCDWAVDHMGESGVTISSVAHTLEEAKETFARVSYDEKQYAKEHGWTVYVDTDTEFDAGEDGYYNAEHTHFYIQEVDDTKNVEDDEYTPSSTNGDYSPSNPWDAPGMKISDFI